MEKANKQTTYIAIILDRSGSMWNTKAATVRGYNEQVQQIKEDSKDENHDIFVSLITFNGSVTEHLWNVPAEQLEEASEEDFHPKGSTAMRDALGHTIQKLMDTTDSDDPDTAYLVCIITDGEENSSKHFNVEALKELTESVQGSDKWTINYMGCNKSYLEKVAQETSVPVANCAIWANDTVRNTDNAFRETRRKLGGYMKGRACGMSSSVNFHSSTDGEMDNYTIRPTGEQIDTVIENKTDNQFNPLNKQDIFNDAMKTFGITDATDFNKIKPLNNVFTTGKQVDSGIWAEYASRGTTTSK